MFFFDKISMFPYFEVQIQLGHCIPSARHVHLTIDHMSSRVPVPRHAPVNHAIHVCPPRPIRQLAGHHRSIILGQWGQKVCLGKWGHKLTYQLINLHHNCSWISFLPLRLYKQKKLAWKYTFTHPLQYTKTFLYKYNFKYNFLYNLA